jgi:hypothetical protein
MKNLKEAIGMEFKMENHESNLMHTQGLICTFFLPLSLSNALAESDDKRYLIILVTSLLEIY